MAAPLAHLESFCTLQVTFSSTQDFSSATQLALDDVEFRNCGFPRKAGGPLCFIELVCRLRFP